MAEGNVFFPKLEEEMRARKVKKAAVCRELGISEKSLYNKLRGICPFTWNEVCRIRDEFFPDLTVDTLFRMRMEERQVIEDDTGRTDAV